MYNGIHIQIAILLKQKIHRKAIQYYFKVKDTPKQHPIRAKCSSLHAGWLQEQQKEETQYEMSRRDDIRGTQKSQNPLYDKCNSALMISLENKKQRETHKAIEILLSHQTIKRFG